MIINLPVKPEVSDPRFSMRKGIYRKCLICDKQFYFQRYRINDKTRGKFCSRKCQIIGRNKTNIGNNPNSRKNLKIMTSKRAKELGFGKWMEGKKLTEEHRKHIGVGLEGGNNGSFKKGSQVGKRTQFKEGQIPYNKGKGIYCSLAEIIRSSSEYREWRLKVYLRDKWSCIWCGYRGSKIHVDHIKSFALILREYNIKTFEEALECNELWNIDNGRTLCIPCHKTTETYFKPLSRLQL